MPAYTDPGGRSQGKEAGKVPFPLHSFVRSYRLGAVFPKEHGPGFPG